MASTWLSGRGVARMKGRYYYFCSGGSFYTVSTVGRRGKKRMGKYMKKARSVKNMEVSQSSLVGVRTRAKALALAKQTNESICKQSLTSSPSSSRPLKTFEAQRIPLNSEPHYMQLRSRRLERDAKCHGIEQNTAGVECNGNDLEFASSRIVDQAPTIVFPSSCKPHVDLRLLNEELLAVPARNSCSSRPDSMFMGISSSATPDIRDASHSRVASPAHSCLHASNFTTHAAISPRTSIIQQRGTVSRMVTRQQQQELDSKVTAETEVTNERAKSESTSALNDLQRHVEIGPCFGESPMIAGASGRERHEGRSTRSQKQEYFLDDLSEVPVSTFQAGESTQMRSTCEPFCRSSEPFSSEIEAFFANAEQNERRRFIDRYNFDPLMEKPLKGRYLWLKEGA